MAITSSIPTFSLLVLLLSPFRASSSNVLLTGDVLPTEGQLTYNDYSFVMQGDCNLVLYPGSGTAIFETNTHGNGEPCSLTLDNRGRLIIRNYDNTPRWNSTPTTNTTEPGQYAAVLRPDGAVTIYGPSIWASPDLHFKSGINTNAETTSSMSSFPLAKNVLFSSQALYDNGTLTNRDYTLVMRDDCDLALVKGMIGDVWGTGTMGKGQHCFARLNHRGRLAVKDDDYKTVWASKGVSSEGEYVLVLQINGQAVIYGPAIWSTASDH